MRRRPTVSSILLRAFPFGAAYAWANLTLCSLKARGKSAPKKKRTKGMSTKSCRQRSNQSR